MLQQWDRLSPGRVETIFKAMGNIAPSQLADRSLFDFASLRIDGQEPTTADDRWLVGGSS